MDSVSQPTEEKKTGNEQSEESKENFCSTPKEDSPEQQCPEKKCDEQTAASDQASGTKSLPSSSSETPLEQSSSANQDNSTVKVDSVQEQISQSETEKQASPVAPIPELTLVGKFEISPITPATETRPEGSLKLECPQSGVDLFQSKSRSVNEKCGTTTFEVNNFRDGNLKIETESSGTLSSASSSENDLVSDSASSLCNRESSKTELKQQERKDIAESSSSPTTNKNTKSLQSDSCVKRDDSAANALENDFGLDSSKNNEDTVPFGEREAKCLEQINPSSSAGEECNRTEDNSKATKSVSSNYTSMKIINVKKDKEKCENVCTQNSLENTADLGSICNQKTNCFEKTSLSSDLNLATTPNTSCVSSLVEQNVYAAHETTAVDTAVKDTKKPVRDCSDFGGGSSNINDNVVSSSNNINSSSDEQMSSYDLKRMETEVIESTVQNRKGDVSSVVAAESSSGNYLIPSSEHKDGVKGESKLKALILEKVTEFSNRMERQNSLDSSSSKNPLSAQSYQSATKEFVASKIRHFYDNKSVISANQENRLKKQESEIQSKPTQNLSGYNNYCNFSKENESNTRSSSQFYNPPISSSSASSSYLDIVRDSSSAGKSEYGQLERSYNQQYSDKLHYQHPASQRISTPAVKWRTENQANFLKPTFESSHARENNASTTIGSSVTIAKPQSSTNPNINRISGTDTTSHLPISKRLGLSIPEQSQQQAKIDSMNSIVNQTRETDYQRYVNPMHQEREKEIKRSNIVAPEPSQYVEPQVRTNIVDPNQSRAADYQKYLTMVNHEKEKECQRQMMYNPKTMNHVDITSHQLTNSTESSNRPISMQNQVDMCARSSHPQSGMVLLNRRSDQIQNHSDSMRRPSPVQNHMDSMRRPSPVQSHSEAIRRPSPIQSHAEAMRRPSPVQIHQEAIRRPSPVQSHAESLRRPSPVQNQLESLRRPSPIQMNSLAHNHSLYVNNPDFSKQMLHTQKMAASSNHDLSQLHTKPPDFTKTTPVQQANDQNLSQPEVKVKERLDCLRQAAPLQITHQNFAEISKKYNYISDLQLKNPAPLEERSAPGQLKMHYNNLYVKAPDFSSEKFQNKQPLYERSSSFESQQQHQPYPATKASNNQFMPQHNENSYARQFPQLSHDVELSVVPQKSANYPTEKPSSYCEYQMYNKSSPYAQEVPQKPQEKNVRPSVLNEQYAREQAHYQNRVAGPEYAASFTSSTHPQVRDQYPQVTPSRQSYPTDPKLPARPNEPLAKPYETSRYDPKVQQNTFSQNYQRESFLNYNYPQGAPSVIQSSKAKESYPEYSAQNQPKSQPEYTGMNPAHRSAATNANYYMSQQATPPTPPSSASSIPSPSHITSTRLYPNQVQQQQSISNPSSPACLTQGSYKTTPSPGSMNPPYGWPSQTSSRIPSQGPSVSPHTVYRQASPLGINAPSPHSQSPSFLQPSPKASPSPTNLMSRPSPQTPNVHMNYKTPYAPPIQQNMPSYYQQVDPSNRNGNNSGYFIKTEKPVEKPSYQEPAVKQYKPPNDPKPDQGQFRQMETKQGFRPHEYPPTAAYMQKPATCKRAEYTEYQSPVLRKSEPQQVSYKPPQQLNETVARPDYHSTLAKSASDLGINKLNQKPNYREMINHVYAIRNATSEKELNAEIIKRTLKKDITRRSDSDLSKSIFDSPDPTKNCGYFARSVECLPALRAHQEDPKRMESYMVPKYANNAFDQSRKPSYPELPKAKSCEYLNRKPSIPLCNELAQNDISVTVSKVIKAPTPENTRPPERNTQSFQSNYPTGNEFSSVVISKVNPSTSVDHSVPKNLRTKETTTTPPSALEMNKPTSSVFNPVKRESPLDLSVKTVKTKADSTGCDDINSYHNRINTSTASALKVDFAPNFSKHTVGDGGSRANAQAPPVAYDPRYQTNATPMQNSRICPQLPAESSRYSAVSQSRPSQQQIQQPNPIQQSTHHQYSSHHPPAQPQVASDAQNSTRMPPNNFPNIRQDQMYPGNHVSQNLSSYTYQPSQVAHLDQKSNSHAAAHQQQTCFPPTQSHKPQVECQKPKEAIYPALPRTNSHPPDTKHLNPYLNPYLHPKKELDNVKQSVILNPPRPITVFDKKSDDYLVNTPQPQSKTLEKVRESNLSKIVRPVDQPARGHPTYGEPSHCQENSIRYGSSISMKNNRPDVPPKIANHMDRRYATTSVQKPYAPDVHPHSDLNKYESKPEEHTKKMDSPKSLNVTIHNSNVIPDQYSHYTATSPAEPHKPMADYKAQPLNKVNIHPEHNEPMQDRFRSTEYHRKRPPEPAQSSNKSYPPPEKRVRVDELYRAHLEETYRQQQKQQQQHPSPSQSNISTQLERRDMSVIQPTGESSRKNDAIVQANYATVHHKPPGPYGYPYKEEYQKGRESVPLVLHQHPQASQQPWYTQPQTHPREKGPQESADMVKRELQPYHHLKYNDSIMQNNDLERSRMQQDQKRQAPTASEALQKTALPTVSSNSPTTSNNTVLRGADQNVISKLRTSIEMREYEKQKSSLLKKQAVAVGELGEEESNKPDIASLLAARIRTKGELKGFTPLPQTPPVKVKEPEKEVIQDNKESLDAVPVIDPFEAEEAKSFDLLDWGSACNDFVEQLLTGNNKKRKKRRNTKSAVSYESNNEKVENVVDKEVSNFPKAENNCDIVENVVEQVKAETEEVKENKIGSLPNVKEGSSSDEDKPLLQLKQQRGSDANTTMTSDADSKINKLRQPSEGCNDLKSQGSDSTVHSKRNNIVEKLSEKIVRNMREKQRMEQERRLAARLSQTSSSDSDDDIKRNVLRQKKPRKQRSRASGASTREVSVTGTSDSEEKIISRNLIRSRNELRKRRRVERLSTDSDSASTEQAKKPQKLEKDCDKKLPEKIEHEGASPAKKEMITKARVKCMRLSSQSSESSEEHDEKAACKESVKKPVKEETKADTFSGEKITPKKESEDESNNDQSKQNSLSPCKLRNKRTVGRQSVEEVNVKETMTRSKRKKELEQQMANSKILRNEKIVQNVVPVEKKMKVNDKSTSKSMKTSEKDQEEKSKVSPSKGKSEKSDELKRKNLGNESDDKLKKRRLTKVDEVSSSSSSDSSKESEDKTVSDRVRSRRSRLSNEKNESEILTRTSKKSKTREKQKEDSSKNISGKSKKSAGKNKIPEPDTTNGNTEKFPPGWELEVYQYKRALKVPASLISIKGPVHHRVSTSLPDLDPHSSDASESFPPENSKQETSKITTDEPKKPSQPKNSKKGSKSKKEKKEEEPEAKPEQELTSKKEAEPVIQPKSIIDVLHSRMLKSKKLSKKNSKTCQNNEPKLLPRGSNEAELLPTPTSVQDNKNPFTNEHHNLFETEVLKSRTRTEYRILKNKELIREVFGGEDRPASAPPEIRDIDPLNVEIEPITFDQKYQQYLQKMNVDFGEKIRKNRKPQILAENSESGTLETCGIVIKTEKIDEDSATLLNNVDDETQDTEINECFQTPLAIKEEALDVHERDTPSVTSEREGVVTPLIFKRRKLGKNRSGRRKGSSGFDYIRKKKKVTTNANGALDLIKRKRISPVELFHTRDENDVSKEIQKWVLNKSVGQSALHKAARLGYLDVIAYCLERLGMNPDPKDNAGYTPLHEACAKGRIDIARILLQYGANHSETAHSGIRPLHEASENGYIEIVRLLLSYGADPLLTTYSGQTPFMLAESTEMEHLLKNHLNDVQNTGPHKQPWKFPGPWKIYDAEEYGYNVLEGAPEFNDEEEPDEPSKDIKCEYNIQKSKDKCDTNSNVMIADEKIKRLSDTDGVGLKTRLKSISAKCTVVLDNIDSLDHMNSVKQFNDCHSKFISRRRSTFEKRDSNSGRIPTESEGEGEIFEFEESDMPLPPLYLLKDEGSEKWVLLNDLCNLLKVKSKDTLLKQICPSIPPSTVNKELLRELKMSDFLERATCLQLLCAGEKLNISSSKVVLVKYNDSVRSLLGVKTILMKF